MRPMRKDIADERGKSTDGHLAGKGTAAPVHLNEEDDAHNGANRAANRGELRVLQAEGGGKIAARHDQKTGKPGAAEFLDREAGNTIGATIITCGNVELQASHSGPLLMSALELQHSAGNRNN